jgi:hypothetical protein
MYGTIEIDRSATGVLRQKMSTSRVGMRWERILRTHRPELDALIAVHPDLYRHVSEAVRELAAAGVDSRVLDGVTLHAALQVLDDLQRLGGFELERAAAGLREELFLARGRSLDDVLA